MVTLAITYLLTWVVLLNSAFLAPKAFTPFAKLCGDTLGWRCAELLWRLPLLLGLGYFVDRQTYLKPHSAWQSWEFYATWLALSLLIMLPGVLAYLRKQKDLVA